MSGRSILHVAAVEFTAARFLRPQLEFLASRGYSVRVACAPQVPGFANELRPFRPEPIAFPRSFSPADALTAARHLRKMARDIRPSLIHFHSPAAALPGRLALAASRSRPTVVYTAHGFLHTWDSRSLQDRVVELAERAMTRVTDGLLLQSVEDFENAVAAGYKGQLMYLGNGVGDEWFARRDQPINEHPFRVLFVGRLTREKGVCELLEAARALPHVRVTFVGDALPSDRDSVASDVKRAARESNGRIIAAGMVDSDAVRRHIATANLLALPSWREGLPRSIIEAMAGSLPVVATDIRGCRELVEDGVNGWLIPPRNTSALVAAIRNAASLPRDQLAAMGRAGHDRAWAQHREADVCQRVFEMYQCLGVRP